MVYISRSGTVQQKKTGVIAIVLGFFYGLLELIKMFFQTLVSPDASTAVRKKRDGATFSSGAGGRPDGGGGPGGRPRISGLSDINGAARGGNVCYSGG